MLLVSAMAFVAQGLLPTDMHDPDGVDASMHAAAWSIWWLAFAVGGGLFVFGTYRADRLLALSIIACASLAVPALTLLAPTWWPPAVAQRLAYLLWFVGLIGLAGTIRCDPGRGPA